MKPNCHIVGNILRDIQDIERAIDVLKKWNIDPAELEKTKAFLEKHMIDWEEYLETRR